MDQQWREYVTPDGRKYWYNTITKASTWTKPTAMLTPLEQALASQPWKEYATQDGKKYWHNPSTKQSVWEMPQDYRNALSKSHISAKVPPLAQTMVSGGLSNFAPRDRDNVASTPTNDRLSGYGYPDGSRNNAPAQQSQPEYSSYEEAEAAFFKLLKRIGAQAEWSWEETIRATIKDPQYRALKDPKERKTAWEKYIVELKIQEKDRAKERLAKLQSDFTIMLKSHPEIKHDTRWKAAKPILEGEVIFKTVDNDEQRRRLFKDYILELRKAETDRKIAMRNKAMEELIVILKAMQLEPYSRWRETQSKIENNESFKNEEYFRYLSKLDILKAFEEHIKQLERAFNDLRQRQKKEKIRQERINRDRYKELLAELRANNKIKVNTKWMEIYPSFKDDPRYTQILGQRGSTPLDLFWDLIVEEEQVLRAKKSDVLDILDDKRYELSANTDKVEFFSVVKSDQRAANIDDESLSLIFERLQERIMKRDEEEKHYAERQQRRIVDALRSRIKHLEPPIVLSDTWEQVRARIEKYEEYRLLSTDDLRRSAYEKVIRRLKEKEENDRDFGRRDQYEREYDHRNGYSRDKRYKTRSPELDAYEADRRKAQADRERQYRKSSVTGLSPPHRKYRDERDRYERRSSKQGSLSHYDHERRERDAERERLYISRADPREKASELDYGDSKPITTRRRRDSDGESVGTKRENKRSRKNRDSCERTSSPPNQQLKVPQLDAAQDSTMGMRSGSEEGEIEED